MSQNKGFITLTVVFEAMSLNRDEGMGNIQTLHLLNRGNGNVHSYMSRQALTFAVRKCLLESGEWKETSVTSKSNVSQYDGDIDEFQEIDLFGYMKTESKTDDKAGKSIVRPAAVTFTHAVSLEPYNGDIAFYANPEMARREGNDSNPNPYNRQEHKSLYKYSVVIDLNRISKQDGDDSEQDREKARTRLKQLLDAIGNLHHQIAAYRESLSPLFIAAAHCKFGSPIFHNYVELCSKIDDRNKINTELFDKGILHAGSIPANENKPIWSVVEGSGDMHLTMSQAPEPTGENNNEKLKGKKEIPMEVITQVKSWIDKIYAG